MSAATTSAKKILDKFDSRGKGKLTNNEFKNALRELGIGLKSHEID